MTTSVIVCAYTLDRWTDLQRAVASLGDQTVAPDEILVVIDHNTELLERAQRVFGEATVLANEHDQGLSGARNTGVLAARGDVILFLDDDAYADSKWIAANLRALEDPEVVGVGSWIEPNWEGGEPDNFPDTFRWVMGCSYSGLPGEGATIRNPIGAGMAMRREVFTQVGGFSSGLGRVGSTPLGCEETELAIRYSQHRPEARFVHAPGAVVHHYVPRSRLTWSYFLRRCWAEGLSKAAVAALVGAGDGLSAERQHAMRALPLDILRSLALIPRRPRAGAERVARIVAGTVVAALGVLRGTWAIRRHPEELRGEKPVRGWRPFPMVRVNLEESLSEVIVEDPETTSAWVEIWRDSQLVARRVVSVDHGVVAWGSPSEFPSHSSPEGTRDAPLSDSTLPHITVVVCTIYEDPDLFNHVLGRITTLDYPHFDVVVVDNRRGDNAPELLLAPMPKGGATVTVVREKTPGLSAARNRGILNASGEVVAFTDDDVLVDERWLRALGERFVRSPDVVAVGGLVLPAEMEHQAQVWFEEYFGGFSRDYSLQVITPEIGRTDPLYPYAAGRFGAGANMAFRRGALLERGGFSMSLGTGTPSRGGEDLDIFLRLALAQETLCFDPSAIVRHRHRTTDAALRRQVVGYGAGLTAVYAELISRDPRHIWRMARRALAGIAHLDQSRRESSPTSEVTYPGDLKYLEWRGALWGPWWNYQARREVRRLDSDLLRVFGRPR